MKSIKKEIIEYYKAYHWNWQNPNPVGGTGEDNNMESYKSDILSTRYRFRKIAEYRDFQKPFRFKRRDFKWQKEGNHYYLFGKLILIDNNNKELISDTLTWLFFEFPYNYSKIKYFSIDGKKYHRKRLNRLIEMEKNLTRLGVLKNG